jgi:hypothetical protein
MPVKSSISGFFGEESEPWHQVQVTVGERLNYIELLSAANCDSENGRDWKAFPVLCRGSSLDQPVTHHFSSTSHWLWIQNPPLEI